MYLDTFILVNFKLKEKSNNIKKEKTIWILKSLIIC